MGTSDSATLTMSGGMLVGAERFVTATGSSLIRLIGTDFAVDGSPVPYGNLTATSGLLTGTLASGDLLEAEFDQGGGSYTGTITLSPPAACSDFVDNDGDGLIDYPDDPGCFDPLAAMEDPQCQDGINNDPGQDGFIDYDGGASAGVPPEWQTDPDPQCVGTPWKNREARPSSCGIGVELALALVPLMWLWQRRHGV